MEFDNYIIEVDGIEKKIYPMAEINIDNEIYIIYVEEIKDAYSQDDFFVGQEKDNALIPVDRASIYKFEKELDELIMKIVESKRDY